MRAAHMELPITLAGRQRRPLAAGRRVAGRPLFAHPTSALSPSRMRFSLAIPSCTREAASCGRRQGAGHRTDSSEAFEAPPPGSAYVHVLPPILQLDGPSVMQRGHPLLLLLLLLLLRLRLRLLLLLFRCCRCRRCCCCRLAGLTGRQLDRVGLNDLKPRPGELYQRAIQQQEMKRGLWCGERMRRSSRWPW